MRTTGKGTRHPPPVSFRTPVIVRPAAEGRFAMMDGYHRLAAALALGRRSLRGVVATEEEIRDPVRTASMRT